MRVVSAKGQLANLGRLRGSAEGIIWGAQIIYRNRMKIGKGKRRKLRNADIGRPGDSRGP